MLLIHLLRFIKGIVSFRLTGGFIERFLNLCMRAGIPVFDTVRSEEGVTARTTARSYRSMRPIAKKTGVRVRLTSKSGLPFLMHRYRRRAGLAAGLLLFFLFLGVMSRFIWNIEIEGNETIPRETILESLEACGVREGAYVGGIDTLEAERRMMLLIPDISWIAINLRASTAAVEISEQVRPPEMIDSNVPCNVVAARTGQIVEMEVYEGEPVVKVGDAVAEGQLIVSSFVGGIKNREIQRMTHARAKVLAEFQEDVEIRVALEEEIREPLSDERVKKRSLSLFGLRVPFYISLPKTTCNVYKKSTQPIIAGLKLPLEWITETYEPVAVHHVRFTEDQAREEALSQLLDYEKEFAQIGEIASKTANGALEGEVYVIHAQYTLRQDIARQKEIGFVNPGEENAPPQESAGNRAARSDSSIEANGTAEEGVHKGT